MTDARRREMERGIAILRERGVVWRNWAAEIGVSRKAVSEVVNGRSKALRGLRHRAAEALRAVARQEDARRRPGQPAPDPRDSLAGAREVVLEIYRRDAAGVVRAPRVHVRIGEPFELAPSGERRRRLAMIADSGAECEALVEAAVSWDAVLTQADMLLAFEGESRREETL